MPGRCQAIIWTNAGILSNGPLGTKVNFNLISSYIFIQENPFQNVVWKMAAILSRPQYVDMVNTLRPRQMVAISQKTFFKCIFLNDDVWISITISLNVVPGGPINNIPSLVQIMAWCWPGNKPLSEPMMIRLPTHICVTWPQWVNHYQITPHHSSKVCIP